MLVITRRINESVIIDDCIEIIVTGITKDGVRLGINAPRDKKIYRQEVYEAIAEANRAGASSAMLKSRLTKLKPPEPE